ncbi:MAG: hypothetical protein A3E83_02345 [Gammaproteobacteria bacterium RIFCSPHIGHO2_12_FULL_41_20]|nr:MAG: hypothetical protein A3E83_02345 [Gammaproteobacteria bacterium RIFCSPHIGHO2_12_FULL_41_20]
MVEMAISRRDAGVTLLEVMLVLAIGAMIVVLSLRSYFTYRANTDVTEVQRNVDTLFQALQFYYRANCNGVNYITTFAGSCTSPLDPRCNNNTLSINVPINIHTQLVAPGFLSTTNTNPSTSYYPFGPNSIVSGYKVQFNSIQPYPIRSVNLSAGGTQGVGSIVMWQAQVAVQLKDSSKAAAYLYALGGNCASSAGGNIVTPCTAVTTSGAYIVWQRMPSFAAVQSRSPFWVSMPLIQQFNQMYTTYPITLLLSAANWYQVNNQYFLCGS